MAEIKVAIKGDNEDFKRKMAESGAEARHFSEQVKESLAKTKDAAADMMGEAGFGGIKKVLTGAGVVAFGAGLIEAFKKGRNPPSISRIQVSKLRSTLGVAQAGMADDIAKWIESISGIMGSIEENMSAFAELKRAGMSIPEAQNALLNIQNLSRQSGGSIEELTHAFARMKESGEMPERFLHENIGIAERAKNMLPPGVAPDAAFMLRSLLPSFGGLQNQARIEAEATEAGQLKSLGVQYTMMGEEIAHELLPSMKDFTGWLKAEIPIISEDLKGFAAALEGVLKWIGSFAPAFTRAEPGQYAISGAMPQVGPRPDYSGIWNFLGAGFQEALKPLNESTQKHNEAADKLNRALDPK